MARVFLFHAKALQLKQLMAFRRPAAALGQMKGCHRRLWNALGKERLRFVSNFWLPFWDDQQIAPSKTHWNCQPPAKVRNSTVWTRVCPRLGRGNPPSVFATFCNPVRIKKKNQPGTTQRVWATGAMFRFLHLICPLAPETVRDLKTSPAPWCLGSTSARLFSTRDVKCKSSTSPQVGVGWGQLLVGTQSTSNFCFWRVINSGQKYWGFDISFCRRYWTACACSQAAQSSGGRSAVLRKRRLVVHFHRSIINKKI